MYGFVMLDPQLSPVLSCTVRVCLISIWLFTLRVACRLLVDRQQKTFSVQKLPKLRLWQVNGISKDGKLYKYSVLWLVSFHIWPESRCQRDVFSCVDVRFGFSWQWSFWLWHTFTHQTQLMGNQCRNKKNAAMDYSSFPEPIRDKSKQAKPWETF